MNINLQVVYSLKDGGSVLCFRHAIHAALAGQDVETQVDDFGDEGDMRSTSCHLCLSDTFNEVFNQPEVFCPDYDDEEPETNYILEAAKTIKKPLTEKERNLQTNGFHLRKKNGV